MKHISEIPDADLESMTYSAIANLRGVDLTASAISKRHSAWADASMRKAATRPRTNRGSPARISPPATSDRHAAAFARYLLVKQAMGEL